MSVRSFLERVGEPMPWRVAASRDHGQPAHGIRNAADQLHKLVYDSVEDARRMTAITAIAPEALAYIEVAAARGGQEAQAILARFERMAGTPV